MTQELFLDIERQELTFLRTLMTCPGRTRFGKCPFVVGAKKGWEKGQFDPDPTYELTTDNVMKMLAIHMRFRCEIPVIIMGETGCGKTRLIRFLCDLQREDRKVENMKLVKVHGGTTSEVIYRKVQEAENLLRTTVKNINLTQFCFLMKPTQPKQYLLLRKCYVTKLYKGTL